MKSVVIDQRREIKYADIKGNGAQEADFTTLITEPCMIYERTEAGDELMMVYADVSDDAGIAEIEHALDDVPYSKISRISGPAALTKTFGYRPRHGMRAQQIGCGASMLAREKPDVHQVVAAGAKVISEYYRRYNPDLYSRHREYAETKVVNEYHLEETAFTSGIINKNNPLGYHYDRGNFRDVWSGMLVFKRFIEGGYLSLPEYGIGIELRNRSLLMFDGQGLIHGVTPIKKLHPTLARRYSVVYYSLQGMWECLPVTEEMLSAKERRTAIEHRAVFDPEEMARRVKTNAKWKDPTHDGRS